MGYSPYTDWARRYVGDHPGCTKYDLASALRKDRRTNPTRLYRLVDTQIRLGHIVAQRTGRGYTLYLPGQEPHEDVRSAMAADAARGDAAAAAALRDYDIDHGEEECE